MKSKVDKDRREDSRKWTRHEFWQDKIDREYILPEGIDYDLITAKQENGILSIVIPKKKVADKVDSSRVIKIE